MTSRTRCWGSKPAHEHQLHDSSFVPRIEFVDLDRLESTLGKRGDDLVALVAALRVAFADVDSLAIEHRPSGHERAPEELAAAIGRSDLEMEVVPLIDERLL